MRPTEWLQESRKMRFEEVSEGWNAGRLTQSEAAPVLGVWERSFCRYRVRYEAEGLSGLLDRRLERASNRAAPVDEVMAMQESCRERHPSWNVRHFHEGYRREGGAQPQPGQEAPSGRRVGAPEGEERDASQEAGEEALARDDDPPGWESA
jgi:hypothetical protein